MAIARVESFVLVHHLSHVRGPSIAWFSPREALLVKLTDDDGAAGWGETYYRPGLEATIEQLAEVLVGQDPAGARPLWRALRGATVDTWAVSALSIALDDLRARRLGVPVYALYGGMIRDRVRAYASSGGYYQDVDPEESWPREVAEVRERGFTALKLRIGRYPVEREVPILERVREEAPSDFELMADGNAAYTLPTAIRMGRVLERLGFRWFEEPLPQWQSLHPGYAGYERLAQSLDIALAAGEGLENRGAVVDFLARAKADIVQPDVNLVGGIAEMLFIAELAKLHSIAFNPHCFNTAISLAATVQLLACVEDPTAQPAAEDAPLLEWDTSENPFMTEILAEPIPLEGGWVSVPRRPGLGIEVDEDAVRRLAPR